MKFFQKVIVAIGIAMLISGQVVFAQSNLVEKTSFSKMNANQIERLVDQIVAKHPKTLTKVKLGTSSDGRTLYAIQLHKADQTVADAVYHGLVESGTHAKETVNPYITIKMIEQYANDLEDEKTIPDYNMSKILDKGVLHFVPLSNPDGYDIVKFGAAAIRSENLRTRLNQFGRGSFSEFKASATGVDLNRNYPAEYFSVAKNQWTKVPYRTGGSEYASRPSKAYYAGSYLGSEPETQSMMSYIQSYDFRFLASYHSRGNLIYYERPYLGLKAYNEKAEKYARIAASTATYRMMNYKQMTNYNGYLGDYFANNTLSPAITIETTVNSLPTKVSVYEGTYNRVKYIPAKFMMEVRKEKITPYWVYLSQDVKQNFIDRDYAMAFADYKNGQYVLEQPNIEVTALLQSLNVHQESTFDRLSVELTAALNPPKAEGIEGTGGEDGSAAGETNTTAEKTSSTVGQTSSPEGVETLTVSQKVTSMELLSQETESQWISSNCIVKQDWTAGDIDLKLGQSFRSIIGFSNTDSNNNIQAGTVEITAYIKWVNKKPMASAVEYVLTLKKQ